MNQRGLNDLDAGGLSALRAVSNRIERVFAAYGYAHVDPPMIEEAEALLEFAGEETRRRAYLFEDPRGNEICLRPELTIPVCRLLLRSGGPGEDVHRLSYIGQIFRNEDPAARRPRHFHQAGIEIIGHTDPVAAEAEAVAVALDVAGAAGITEPLMLLGDVRFLRTLLDHYPLPERLKLQLKSDLRILNPESGAQSVNRAGLSRDQMALAQSVAAIGKDKAVHLIEGFLSVAEIDRIGTRGIDEIVERMIENADDRHSAIPAEIAEDLRRFLSIEDEPRDALEDIEAFGRSAGVDFTPIADEFRRRIDLLEAYGVETEACVLGTAVRRDMDYYSGFIFELGHDDGTSILPLGGGGRYDRIMAALDPQADVPASGFALAMERMILATQPDFFTRALALTPRVRAHVIANAPTPLTVVVEAAGILRRAGWTVTTDIAPREAQARPKLPNCPWLVIVNEDPGDSPRAFIRHLPDNTQVNVPLDQLADFASKQGG